MKFKTTAVLTILLIGILLLGACSAQPEAQSGKLTVVATTNIIGDVVANVGGEAIELTTLIEVGQDPHSFEPTPRDLAAIEDADLIFVNGLGLEEALVDPIEINATGEIITVSGGIEPPGHGDEHAEGDDHHDEHAEDHDEEGHADEDHNEHEENHDEHDHAAGDPHFWVDPNNVIVWVENIEAALTAADPANEAVYTANAAAYLGELTALDAYIREQTETIPEENRKLVTDHGLYSYFAEEYGYEIIGAVIPTFSTTAGASAGDVAELADLIRHENVPAIFIGATANEGTQNLAQALSEELGGNIQVLPLLSGSLAPQGQPGDNYLDYMRYNIDQIVLGLAD